MGVRYYSFIIWMRWRDVGWQWRRSCRSLSSRYKRDWRSCWQFFRNQTKYWTTTSSHDSWSLRSNGTIWRETLNCFSVSWIYYFQASRKIWARAHFTNIGWTRGQVFRKTYFTLLRIYSSRLPRGSRKMILSCRKHNMIKRLSYREQHQKLTSHKRAFSLDKRLIKFSAKLRTSTM